jgi:hypothetical protein
VEHVERAALHPALHERVRRDDKWGCPLSPGEAVMAESLDVDQVHPAIADSVSHQRPVDALRRALERKSTALSTVEQAV